MLHSWINRVGLGPIAPAAGAHGSSLRVLVRSAGDLGEAVDLLAETPPDLLITRPHINSMPGRIAADYLRNTQHGLPVLVVAGFLEDDRVDVQNTVEEFHAFPKPFRRDQPIAEVKDILKSIREKA